MNAARLTAAMVTACTAIVMSAVPGLAAQAPQEPQQPATTMAPDAPTMNARCQAMMAGRDTMMAAMKAVDERLDALVVTMNAASGMDKATATAAVVSELVTQRRTMRDSMMHMQTEMMGHMMGHMQAGAGSMAACPMMKMPGSGPSSR